MTYRAWYWQAQTFSVFQGTPIQQQRSFARSIAALQLQSFNMCPFLKYCSIILCDVARKNYGMDTRCNFEESRNVACDVACRLRAVSRFSHGLLRAHASKQRVTRLTAVKREKFTKNKMNTSKERLSLLLFNV